MPARVPGAENSTTVEAGRAVKRHLRPGGGPQRGRPPVEKIPSEPRAEPLGPRERPAAAPPETEAPVRCEHLSDERDRLPPHGREGGERDPAASPDRRREPAFGDDARMRRGVVDPPGDLPEPAIARPGDDRERPLGRRGRKSVEGRTHSISSARPSRERPATARIAASIRPDRTRATRVSTFPRISRTLRSGRQRNSWARRRGLLDPTVVPAGNGPRRSAAPTTRQSRGSARRGRRPARAEDRARPGGPSRCAPRGRPRHAGAPGRSHP